LLHRNLPKKRCKTKEVEKEKTAKAHVAAAV
jgi:hypothetical protein